MRSEPQHSPSSARLSSWSRSQAQHELVRKLSDGELDPRSVGDPAATTVFAFVSVLVSKASADGEAWYDQEELKNAIRAKDRRTITRAVTKAKKAGILWTRPKCYGSRACSTYVLELGRTSAELGRAEGDVNLQSAEKSTSERPESAAIVLEAYNAALRKRWGYASSLEADAPVLGPLTAFLQGFAQELGADLGTVARGAMAGYVACKGMSDGALERRGHPIEWWAKWKHVLRQGAMSAVARSRGASSSVRLVPEPPKLAPAEERALLERLAAGKFPTLQRAGAERSWREGKRVAAAGGSGRLSVAAPS